MVQYWLAPVQSEDPLILAADRRLIEGGSRWELFRNKLHLIHPWLLPMVKAFILPADPDAEACGSETGPVYTAPGPVCFDGVNFALSDCGRAFVNRLPSVSEQQNGFAKAAAAALQEQWPDEERGWLEELSQLSGGQRKVIQLRV
ncbi:MAG: hypothetical protein K0R57_5306 [Paenibacillaceae bacterium]|nr:hypothetical protein [Paenibacillaceae bacterium]